VEQIPMMPADKSLIMGLTQSFLVAITWIPVSAEKF
jgi:hypothetical protein